MPELPGVKSVRRYFDANVLEQKVAEVKIYEADLLSGST